MNKSLAWFIIGVILTFTAGHFYTNCRVSKYKQDAIEWKKAYEGEKEKVVANELASNGRIEELLEQIGGLQGNIDSLMFVNAELETKIADKESENAVLAGQYNQMKEEIQPVLDANPKVRQAFENLEAQIVNKDTIIFDLRAARENDAKIIFNLTEKYNAQVQISMEYQAQLKEYKSLLSKAEIRLNLLEGRVASLEKAGAWKTYGIVGACIVALLAVI